MKSKIELRHTSFLVLIKDEEFFSKKLVNHINSQNVEAEFIIADGSTKRQNKIFDKLKVKKKKYYYLGEDKSYDIFLKKVLFSIRKCSKKFIFYCDQDDLLNFKEIKNHEEFLYKNENYSAVKSIIYNFKYLKNKISLMRKDYNDFKDFDSFPTRFFFNPNFRAYYCLHRKKNLKTVYNLANKYNIKDPRTPNFLTTIITLSSGKIKFYNNVSILRWSGLKKRDKKKLNNHVVNVMHKTRYLWFDYLFTEKKFLVKEVLIKQKIFLKNFTFFKIYYFIFDIVMNKITRKIRIPIFNKKNKIINKNQNQIFKELKLHQIINQRELSR
jgi:glycosyltransferase domain-containing protein